MFLCVFISTPCKPLHIYILHSRLWIWFPFRLVCDPKLWIRISHLAPHWNVIFHCHLLFIADNQCVHWNYLHTQEFLASHDNNFAITCFPVMIDVAPVAVYRRNLSANRKFCSHCNAPRLMQCHYFLVWWKSFHFEYDENLQENVISVSILATSFPANVKLFRSLLRCGNDFVQRKHYHFSCEYTNISGFTVQCTVHIRHMTALYWVNNTFSNI